MLKGMCSGAAFKTRNRHGINDGHMFHKAGITNTEITQKLHTQETQAPKVNCNLSPE